MIYTIETDTQTPFGRKSGDPPAEWIYRDRRESILKRAAYTVNQNLTQFEIDAYNRLSEDYPAYPNRRHRTVTVEGFVNHGRWMWMCPQEGCSGAQVASRRDPRGFCVECFNVGEGWYPVIFPEDADLIEQVLDLRPLPANRNWRRGETVEQLRLDNIKHGIDDGLDDT